MNFTQASPPPAARTAVYAFESIATATDIQNKEYQTARIVTEMRNSASLANQAAVRDATNEQSQATKFAGLGDIGAGVFAGAGPVSEGVGNFLVSPKLSSTQDAQARLTNANSHDTAVNRIMNMSAADRGALKVAPVDGGVMTDAQALQVVRNTDLTKPYNAQTHDAALAVVHETNPDAFDAHVKRVTGEKKAAQKASDDLDASHQRFTSQLSTLLQSGGTLMKGGEQLNSADAQSKQADLEALRIATSTEAESMKTVQDQVVQGAQGIDQQKEGIIQTLMRGQSDANHA